MKWDWLILALLGLLGLGVAFYLNERKKFQAAPVVQVQPFAAHDFALFAKDLEGRYGVRFRQTQRGTSLQSILGPQPQVDRVKEEIRQWAVAHPAEAYHPPEPGWMCVLYTPSVVFHQE